MCFAIAKDLGLEAFIVLDDDYTEFRHKVNSKGDYIDARIKRLNQVFDLMVDFLKSTKTLSIAMAQGGDFIGGQYSKWTQSVSRKCMNTFVCLTSRPFNFLSRLNEDVTTYVVLGSKGHLFFTSKKIAIQQLPTQTNAGGVTDLYKTYGTYTKSFYTLMQHPSSVKIGVLKQVEARIHHHITWKNTVPCILQERYKK